MLPAGEWAVGEPCEDTKFTTPMGAAMTKWAGHSQTARRNRGRTRKKGKSKKTKNTEKELASAKRIQANGPNVDR